MVYTGIVVSGDAKNVFDFISGTHVLCKDGRYIFSLNEIIPTPENPDGSIIENWYDWRVENWGVRDECEVHNEYYLYVLKDKNTEIKSCLGKNDTGLQYVDYTELEKKSSDYSSVKWHCTISNAWNSPIVAFDKISKLYKDLNLDILLSYYIESEGIAGHVHYVNGDDVERKEVTCDEDGYKYYEYLLNRGHETIESLLDDLVFIIEDRHIDIDGEEFTNKLIDKVTAIMNGDDATIEQKSKLYYNIKFEE